MVPAALKVTQVPPSRWKKWNSLKKLTRCCTMTLRQKLSNKSRMKEWSIPIRRANWLPKSFMARTVLSSKTMEHALSVCAFCAIDAAYRCGRFHWQKPISCALYPVRLSKVGGVTAVNVHKWNICQPARDLGKQLQMPVYQFLKEPLIRRFGQAWWDECDLAAKELKKAGYLD